VRRGLVLLAATLCLAGCGGGAAQLLETAKLEELQSNPTHARELYREILQRYPSSAEARTAEERLRELGPVAEAGGR
jgi:hypothetical protein